MAVYPPDHAQDTHSVPNFKRNATAGGAALICINVKQMIEDNISVHIDGSFSTFLCENAIPAKYIDCILRIFRSRDQDWHKLFYRYEYAVENQLIRPTLYRKKVRAEEADRVVVDQLLRMKKLG